MPTKSSSDPFTKLHNDLLEAILLQPLTVAEVKVILAIARKTFGYQKRQDNISISQITKLTSIPRRTIYDAITGLKKKKIICRQESMTWICKDFMGVRATAECDAPQSAVYRTTSAKNRTKLVRATAPTKETKENTTKESTHTEKQMENTRSPLITKIDQLKNYPLSYEKIYEIAGRKRVSVKNVQSVYQQVLDSVTDGNKYKTTDVNLATQRWIDLALGRGTFSHLDEIGLMQLDADSPENLKIKEEALEKARKLGYIK